MRDNTTKKRQLAIKVEIPSGAKRHIFPIKNQLKPSQWSYGFWSHPCFSFQRWANYKPGIWKIACIPKLFIFWLISGIHKSNCSNITLTVQPELHHWRKKSRLGLENQQKPTRQLSLILFKCFQTIISDNLDKLGMSNIKVQRYSRIMRLLKWVIFLNWLDESQCGLKLSLHLMRYQSSPVYYVSFLLVIMKGILWGGRHADTAFRCLNPKMGALSAF